MSIFASANGFNLTNSVITSIPWLHNIQYFPGFRPVDNMAFSIGLPWNSGEDRMHKLLNVPSHDNPTSSFLTPQAAFAVSKFPLTAIGVLDQDGKPWTSVWGGTAGHSRPLGQSLVGTRTVVDGEYDPVVQALVSGEFGKGAEGGMMVSGLPIDLVKRMRVKLFGRAVAGAIADADEEQGKPVKEVHIVLKIEQSLGNCPKYLNSKEIQGVVPEPELRSSGSHLSIEAVELVNKADLFFMTTSNANVDMDTNHRGGPPGFIRVVTKGDSSSSTGAKIIYPEYSGNRLYQSLGNLINTPAIGICIPDFTTGDVLYITGTAEILVGAEAAKKIPHTNLAVEISIIEARYVAKGLPFRGVLGEFSPYNPRVRPLASEGNIAGDLAASSQIEATLLEKEDITSTISRYRFRTNKALQYNRGQWIALDLSEELDTGYSHMRDDDPASLNDDFVRTFTISSHPSTLPAEEFEITLRTNGPVTTFLRRQNPRAALEVSVLGVGGEFIFDQSDDGVMPFIAGGVGITPLLGQLKSLDISKLRLLWIIRVDDVGFVLDTFERNVGLAKVTTVFFTGGQKTHHSAKLEKVKAAGANLKIGRPKKEDLLEHEAEKWYLCAGNPLRKQLLEWLEGKVVIFENFDY